MSGLLTVGCQDSPPSDPAPKLSAYAQQFVDAEQALATGNVIGVYYLHPMRKRACNTMQARISSKVCTGLEHRWEVAEILEIGEQASAPVERRNLGTHPTFAYFYGEGPHRIDAISCTAYDGTATTQYQNFAEFSVEPGEVVYLGDFTQARLAEGVDLYLPADNFDVATDLLELDSPALASSLERVEVTYFTFENFDGKIVTSQDVYDNVGDYGDYFTLSQSLKTQAEDVLLPFLGYLPAFDVPPISTRNFGGPNQKKKNLHKKCCQLWT